MQNLETRALSSYPFLQYLFSTHFNNRTSILSATQGLVGLGTHWVTTIFGKNIGSPLVENATESKAPPSAGRGRDNSRVCTGNKDHEGNIQG